MKFKKKNKKRYISRSDADIIAAKIMLDDSNAGIKKDLKYYDQISDKLSGLKSREIYS